MGICLFAAAAGHTGLLNEKQQQHYGVQRGHFCVYSSEAVNGVRYLQMQAQYERKQEETLPPARVDSSDEHYIQL